MENMPPDLEFARIAINISLIKRVKVEYLMNSDGESKLGEIIKSFIAILCMGMIVYYLIEGTADSRAFKKLNPIEVESTLIEINYLPSTKTGNLAPIFHGGDISMAYYSTGHTGKYTTIWNCGKYGRIICDKEDVYRYAKEKSILYIKSNHYKTEIVGIKKNDI